MTTRTLPLLAAVSLFALPVGARADDIVLQPVQIGQESVRYQQGSATLELHEQVGAIQISPLPMDHGNFAFEVAVLNTGSRPANFDIGNVQVQTNGKPVQIFSAEDLIHKANNRSHWSQFGMALLGATTSALAANQKDTYSATLYTRHGSYSSTYRVASVRGQMQADRIQNDTAEAIAGMRDQLDKTRQALGSEVIRTTTINPGDSYAGRMVIAKISPQNMPQRLDVTVTWNGEVYPFAFQIAKAGTPAPQFTNFTTLATAAPPAEPRAPTSPAVLQAAPARMVAARVDRPASAQQAELAMASVDEPRAYHKPVPTTRPRPAHKNDWGLVEVPSQVGY